MIWYVIGAVLWLASLVLVVRVFRMENARNSERAMELEKRFSALQQNLRRMRSPRAASRDAPVPREGTIEP